ncbi:hemicentin-1 [Biomphalaria glabrata]
MKKHDKSTENKGDNERVEEKYHYSDDSYKDTAVEEVTMSLDERSSAEETPGEYPFTTVKKKHLKLENQECLCQLSTHQLPSYN